MKRGGCDEVRRGSSKKSRKDGDGVRLWSRRKCCFSLCDSGNNGTDKVTYHTFPNIYGDDGQLSDVNVERCKLWVKNSGNLDLFAIAPGSLFNSHYVCSMHFKPNSYQRSSGSVKYLKGDAVPTEMIVSCLEDLAVSTYFLPFVSAMITTALEVDGNDKSVSGNVAKVTGEKCTSINKRKCCFKLCIGKVLSNEVSMHSFPSILRGNVVDDNKLKRCSLWVQNSGNKELFNIPMHGLNRRYFVCSDHFKVDCYANLKIRRLRDNAIPTENLIDPHSAPIIAEYVQKEAGMEMLHTTSLDDCVALPIQNCDTEVVVDNMLTQDIGVSLVVPTSHSRKCCFKKCLGGIEGKHSFHTFPSVLNGNKIDESKLLRCRSWLQNSGNKLLLKISTATLHGRYFVCDKHFKRDCYTSWKARRLKENAVPTEEILDPFGEDIMISLCVDNYAQCSVESSCIDTPGTSGYNRNHEGIGNQELSDGTVVGEEVCSIQVGSESISNPVKGGWRRCCFTSCKGTSEQKGSLHSFPNIMRNNLVDIDKLSRCKLWVQNSGNVDLLSVPTVNLRNKYFVCSQHFKDDCFLQSKKCRKLCNDAVPTEMILNEILESEMMKFPIWGVGQDIFSGIIDQCVDQPIGSVRRLVALNVPDHIVQDRYQKKFEDHMRAGCWVVCNTCKETFVHYGKRKKRCLHTSELCKSLSEANVMDPGKVPHELSDLSFVEEQLIATIHPVVSVYKIRGQQLAYSGNVINFPQNVSAFAKVLPHKVSELGSVINVRTSRGLRYKDFLVRADRILIALQWLKSNNKFYKSIEISQGNIDLLPVNGNVYDEVKGFDSNDELARECGTDVGDSEMESSENDVGESCFVSESGVPVVNIPAQDELLRNVIDWPTIGSLPVNEFKTEGYIPQAFPCLYPTGEADLRTLRETEIKPSTYFKHMLRYHDRRFAVHPRFRFFAMNSLMRWTAISDGNVFVKNNPEFSNWTVHDLKEKLKINPNLMSKIMFHSKNLRGTRSFWKAKTSELIEMVEQLGLATVFFTLSAADLHWPELFQLLAPEEDLMLMTERRRRQLLEENPIIVDTFFLERVESFIGMVLEPKYRVKDYWFRIEYQHRGSPHVHGLLWLHDAPDVSKLDDMSVEQLREVASYFEKLVCTLHPNRSTPPAVLHPCRKFLSDVQDIQKHLAELLNKVQRHECSKAYCQRVDKVTQKMQCRFKYPFEETDFTTLEKNDKGEYELITERTDAYLNKHNVYIIQSWRANMDIAACLSKRALINYLTKYVTKSEIKSKHLSEMLKSVFERNSDDKAAKDVILNLYMQTCNERDYSAQEVAHIVMSSKYFSSGGRDFVYVNLKKEEEWVQIPSHRKKAYSTFVDKYRNRLSLKVSVERLDKLKSLSMWEVAQKVKFPSGSMRSKDAIVVVYPKLKIQNEDWYRQQVLLFVPWTDEKIFCEDGKIWEDVYMQYEGDISAHSATCHLDSLTCIEETAEMDSSSDQEVDENNNGLSKEEWMCASAMRPNSVAEEVLLGCRDIDRSYDWNQNCIVQDRSPQNIQYLRNFISNCKTNSNDEKGNYDLPNVLFTDEQKQVLNVVKHQMSCIKSGNFTNDKHVKRRVMIQGKAGTGKSLLIHAIKGMIVQELGEDYFILAAPTGVAALNIGGATTYSAFHLPKTGELSPLKGAAAKKFDDAMRNVHFLIIDEYSMIGLNNFGMIERRCREAKGNQDEYFGGMFVYLCGDIKQLPPVRDTALYDVPHHYNISSTAGKAAFESFDGAVILSQVMRQSDQKFKQVLDHISSGTVTDEDYEFLKKRFTTTVSQSEVDEFKDTIKLFPKKVLVKETNLRTLERLRCDGKPVSIAQVRGKHSCAAAANIETAETAGLDPVIFLAKGAKIMLRANLWTSKRLVNGAIGEVVDLVYGEGECGPDYPPKVVLCKFPLYKGPVLELNGIGSLVPIPAVTAFWSTNSKPYSRTQFPLNLAYATTIHKSQGLTLSRVFVDIGQTHEMAPGLTYVGLSRSTCIEGLLLEPFSAKRLKKINVSRPLMLRKKAEEKIFANKLT